MPDSQEWERHWNTISLGIVTVATAAVGVALFTADVAEAVTSWAMYSLAAIAVLAYLIVLFLGSRAIFSTSEELERRGTSKRRIARSLYGWFTLELLVLVGLLIPEVFAGLLQLLAPASPPHQPSP